MRIIEPMQQGRLFLAGDAAHLITPAGGKGMNLAIQDAVELAHGLIERFGPGNDHRRLSAYSATRLPHIWRTQAFSNWFLHLILTSLHDGQEPPAAVPGGFARGLRDAWMPPSRTIRCSHAGSPTPTRAWTPTDTRHRGVPAQSQL